VDKKRARSHREHNQDEGTENTSKKDRRQNGIGVQKPLRLTGSHPLQLPEFPDGLLNRDLPRLVKRSVVPDAPAEVDVPRQPDGGGAVNPDALFRVRIEVLDVVYPVLPNRVLPQNAQIEIGLAERALGRGRAQFGQGSLVLSEVRDRVDDVPAVFLDLRPGRRVVQRDQIYAGGRARSLLRHVIGVSVGRLFIRRLLQTGLRRQQSTTYQDC